MGRIQLRELSEADKVYTFELPKDDGVMEFIGPRRALSDSETEDWFTNECNSPSKYVVADIDSNKLIGFCGVKNIDGMLDFGFFFRRSYWGKGYATESCREVILKIRDSIDLSILEVFIASDNLASIAVARKLGWKNTGLVKKGGENGHLYDIS